MQVSGYFCTLTNPCDGLSARPGPDRSRDELFAQVRRPGILRALLPSFTGGLHCGHSRPSRIPAVPYVLPPFTGGLHCG